MGGGVVISLAILGQEIRNRCPVPFIQCLHLA